jgi:endoglucanase
MSFGPVKLLLATAAVLLLCAPAASAALPEIGVPANLPELPLQQADPRCFHGWQPPGLDPRGVDRHSPNPLRGTFWFIDPEAPAYERYLSFKHRGMASHAELMWKIAGQPRFSWFGRFTRPDMQRKVRLYIDRAACTQPGRIPLMTVMRHMGKGCSPSYSGGGAAEDARTRRWYDGFAQAVGNARVVIAFEPDSLGTIDCLKKSRRAARVRTLAYGVDVLSRLRGATVYIEAGASDWEGAGRTAKLLRKVGIGKVRGFMLNVTHYDWTLNNIRHGLEISRLTGGKPFIINTSNAGRGPIHYRKRVGGERRRMNVWCHPLKRGLGPAPRTQTHHPRVDAYMWISRPGYSSGACNGGPLPVGTFWTERALMLATYATEWLRAPRGTRFGLPQRHTVRQLGCRC